MAYYKKRLEITIDVSFLLEDDIMVNATEMAEPFGYHKRPSQWLRTQHSQELINSLADIKKCTSADLVRVMKGGNDKLNQGTWMHRKLALHYALFLDTNFAV